MICPACAIAETNYRTGHYQSGCVECQARALAQSPGMKRAMSHQGSEDNDAAMRKMWPELEQFRQGRIAVYKWWKRLQEAE
jgi:hypothetical protein